jgi:decaprenylphospho-beta-D-ribofuranose 2-oxidase
MHANYHWGMTLVREKKTELTAWSKAVRSSCYVYRAADVVDVIQAMDEARRGGLTLIPHGAGHSYTDAALNTNSMVIDMTAMRRVIAWDPASGILEAEAGATLLDVVETAAGDGWWPPVAPSTEHVTLGGCAAMNVNGRNSWKVGSFGEWILSMDVLLPSGEVRTITPDGESELFHALVGSLGLLGIILSVRMQLQRIGSGMVTVRRRRAACLEEVFDAFAEEQQRSEFLEAWLDGFARGEQLGRGHLTSATHDDSGAMPGARALREGTMDAVGGSVVGAAASASRVVLTPGVRMWNRLNYHLGRGTSRRGLYSYSFWPPIAVSGYHKMFREGVEAFQAFLPDANARAVCAQVMRYSQQHDCLPLWCIIKRHRPDPFLLSYQVDGFSLELAYERKRSRLSTLEPALKDMIQMVIDAGGRFYLAKDRLMTHAQYRQSMGSDAVDCFMDLKQQYDPESRLQSDLFRRLFQRAE